MDELYTVMATLALLGLANGAPIFAKKIFGRRFSAPVDGRCHGPDGRALFGASKTWRGLALAILVTALAAPLFGHSLLLGAALAALSMLGDLLSSFTKRRLGRPLHSQALGLDQIPESALPVLVLHQSLGLSLISGVAVVVLFFVLELLLSRLLYRWRLRDRPY